MGKRQRFNKKQAVRFTLVPGFDQNGKPTTSFRPVQSKKSKLSAKQRAKIIKQISDQQYDEIQINGMKVGQGQIPAFVLEQIKGRKDLVFNQLGKNDTEKMDEFQGDLYEVIDGQEGDFQQDDQQQKWIEEGQIISENSEEDIQQLSGGQWQSDDNDNENSQSKPFVLAKQQFPTLNKVNIQGQDYQLTEEQIKLLDILLPQDYEKFQIKGLKFQKYDEDGLPISQKQKYEKWLSTGKQGIVDQFIHVPEKPVAVYDNDLKPSEIVGELKEIEEALNFEGEEGAYEQLQDDFFASMIKNEIASNKKQKKKKQKTVTKQAKEKAEFIQKSVKTSNLPLKLSQKPAENIFAKYDELDEDNLQEELTDQMLDKALQDFENNVEPQHAKQYQKFKEQQQQQYLNEGLSKMSMNFSQIQKIEEYMGRDGELDWRCLTKQEKKQYMKTKIIREFYDEVRQREIEEKMRGKKNISPEELHLKQMVKKIKFQQDHVMQQALKRDAQQKVDLSEQSSYQTTSEEEDIVQYRQRTSVITSNLNEISEPSTRKKKKKRQTDEVQQRALEEQFELNKSKLKIAPEKRDKNQTKQERKARKQKLKQLKKEKKEIKKQFAEKFCEERRKHMKMNKPADPLHKIAFVKII